MPKYIHQIVSKLFRSLTLRQLELLAGWVKNTDPQVVQYHLGKYLDVEIREAKANKEN